MDNAWDCPQAIELHLFVQQLGRCQKRATPESKPTTALPAKTITSIADIRHAAVHRHRLSSCDMINVLKDAERFLEFLGDTMRLRRITELRYSTHKDLASLERAEREADEALGRVRKRFDVKRRSLQLLEDDAALRVDRTREKFRGIAADRIAHAVLATREQEAATKRSKRVMEVFVLVATAFCSTISFCVRLLGTKGNFYKT